MTQQMNDPIRLLRVRDIIKPHGILPVCRSTFYNMVRRGLLSPGILLGARTRVWRESEIIALVDRLEAKAEHENKLEQPRPFTERTRKQA